MKGEPKYPRRGDVEIPLLKVLCQMGGSVQLSIRGRELENRVADILNLSLEQREFSAVNYSCEGNRKWRNELQFVRNSLADKGQLDSSRHDFWTVSVAGYTRIGVQPPKHALDIESTYRRTRGANAQTMRRQAILDQL
jgi:Mrr restriction endonuclease-like protein